MDNTVTIMTVRGDAFWHGHRGDPRPPDRGMGWTTECGKRGSEIATHDWTSMKGKCPACDDGLAPVRSRKKQS